jgi:sortase A
VQPIDVQSGRNLRGRWSAICLWAGALLFAVWLVPTMYGLVYSHLELARFQSDHAETIAWAPGRISAYRKALRVAMPTPTAVLKIQSAAMEVPVLEGTTDLVLNRGAGHIAGTAEPGGSGNIVLAGHRDGFFRHLKNVSVGDRIELARPGGTDEYRVDSMRVVDKNDVSALRGGDHPVLTLITCYPFFYLGAAPQRYIVQASLVPHPLQAKLQ